MTILSKFTKFEHMVENVSIFESHNIPYIFCNIGDKS